MRQRLFFFGGVDRTNNNRWVNSFIDEDCYICRVNVFTAMDSAFISEQNGIFSCTLCECTSKLHNF